MGKLSAYRADKRLSTAMQQEEIRVEERTVEPDGMVRRKPEK
ncbi:MAG TPA: hypothetical protein VMT23_00260 [Candidatus Binatia bacterium]|nr:hypothetical protein [Candidatus Binatia bacterium]